MDAHQAEAIVAREGLRIASELGLQSLILEGDATTIFESFNYNEEDLSYTRIILSKAYGFASRFYFSKAQFMPKSSNSVADKLFKLAKDMGSQLWLNGTLPCITDVLALHVLG